MKRGPVPRKPTCHPDRKHVAKGLCQHCYSMACARCNSSKGAKLIEEWHQKKGKAA